MRNYDEIITKLMSSIVQMERFVVESGEPLYVREGVREILRRIEKLDEYMSYGTDSELFNPGYCSNGNKHTYKVIDKDGTAECTKCGLRNSFTQTNKI